MSDEARAEQLIDAMHGAWDDRLGVNANLRAVLNVVRTEREQVHDPALDCADDQDAYCKRHHSVPGELLIVGLIAEQVGGTFVRDNGERTVYGGAPLVSQLHTDEPVYRIIEREPPQ